MGLVLAAIAFDVVQGPRDFKRLTALTDTVERQALFRKWTWQSLQVYGLCSLAALYLLKRLDALGTVPVEFATVMQPGADDFLIGVVLSALFVGMLVPVAAAAVMSKRMPIAIGDFAALQPRNAAERRCVFWLSLNAGVSEELYFRLFIPLLLVLLLGNPWIALGISALVFGITHAYQGWAGMAGTAIVGLVFTAIYLGSGQLWLAMAVHALLNINTLLLRPALMEWVGRRSAAR